MTASDERRELKGLARSIDALFSEDVDEGTSRTSTDAEPSPEGDHGEGSSQGREEEGGEEMVWEKLVESPSAEDADPEALRSAVTRFLDADPLHREGLGHAIRNAAAALREANSLDVLADAVERLARAGEDVPDEAGVAMARALLTSGVAGRLAARLGEAHEEERHAQLVRACVRLGRDMAVALADALSETTDRFARRAYLGALVAMGDDAMSVAEEMLENDQWFVVRNAVAILGEIGGPRAVELVTSSLAHTDAHVRREALLSLAKVGGEDAGMLVYGMIEDTDPEVRLAAAMAAGTLKVERALKPLLNMLEGERDPDAVVVVLQALGQLGDPGATNAVEKRAVGSFLSKPPTGVRIAAYRALGSIGTPRAKSVIRKAATDKNTAVQAAVRQLLEES
ncbi:MAG: HEAT repeat domain-containing protein [Gemmatimonadetes bacterium]|nr:HEAT repeat domain-containing protein [Gemmatimonadota bacterium]